MLFSLQLQTIEYITSILTENNDLSQIILELWNRNTEKQFSVILCSIELLFSLCREPIF